MNYFLKKFPSLEWSGPAWYKPEYKKDELFPKGFSLIHFHPLDLGHSATTVVAGEDIAGILEKTYKKFPETEKCMMGLIHSHHSMGAFFSGTDDKNLKEMAPLKNFYCSTVVASKKDPYAFGVSYQDQYGRNHLLKSKEGDIYQEYPKHKVDPEWNRICKKIEKKKKSEVTVPSYNYNRQYGHYNGTGGYAQGTLWGRDGWGQKKKVELSETTKDWYDEDEKIFIKKLEKLEDPMKQLSCLAKAMLQNEIQWITYEDLCGEMGYDPNFVMQTYLEGVENGKETSKKSRPNTAITTV